MLMDSKGFIRFLVENTLLSEFNKIGPVLTIMARIGNGKRTYPELQAVFNQRKTGNLSRWLSKLVANDILAKDFPINEKNSRRVFYYISDNLFRFYFTYFYPTRSRIDRVGCDAVFPL